MSDTINDLSDGLFPHRMDFSLLLSARAAKFLKLKPPRLVSLKTWGKSWKDPSVHWLNYWRCEECFAMKDTKYRIFIVSNEASRYSFLLRLAPGDVDGLFVAFLQKVKAILRKHSKNRIPQSEVHIVTLSGSAPSLTSFQNQQLFMLSCAVDQGDFACLEDLEEKINQVPTTIDGKMTWVADEFDRLFNDHPPTFVDGLAPKNVIPFIN